MEGFSNYKYEKNSQIDLKSKKGLIITIIILAAITLASFSIWLIPQSNNLTLVITDYESQLNNAKVIHNTITEDLEADFKKVVQMEINSDEFIGLAEISSSQINTQIIQLVQSKAPEEWQKSYLNYIEALKQTNSQIRESIVVATKIKEGSSQSDLADEFERIEEYKKGSLFYADASDSSRP